MAVLVTLTILSACSTSASDSGNPVSSEVPQAVELPQAVEQVAPRKTALVVWGDAGVQIVTDTGVVAPVDNAPATMAVLFETGDVAYQTAAGIHLERADESLEPRLLESPASQRLTLLAGGSVDGRQKLLMTSTVLAVTIEEARQALVLVDVESGVETPLGITGGWERGAQAGRIGRDGFALIVSENTLNFLQLLEPDGSVGSEIELPSDINLSLAMRPGGDTVTVLQPGFSGADFSPGLTVTTVEIESGQVTETAEIELAMDGETTVDSLFCTNAYYLSATLLACDQSSGAPVTIDELSGWLTTPIPGFARGSVAPAIADTDS